MSILHSWKDCGEVNSLDDNNRSRCNFVISMCVDKLEAVPIFCVEQLVSSLFCMNASQSVIISLWRSVPVLLYPFVGT